MSRPTYLTIDLHALRHNLKCIHHYAPHRRVIAMIKANAYGHGITRVATALPQIDAFGVASLEEALILRHAGVKQEIVLMEGLFYVDEIGDASRHGLSLVVHNEEQLKMLEGAKTNYAFPVWLKINTGMHRLGIDPQLTPSFFKRLNALPVVKKPIGFMTHFASAEVLNDECTREQIKLFKAITSDYDGPQSLANSAAIIAWTEAHGDWVRPGLMLYGASPFPNKNGSDFKLEPVMTLSSRLIAINHVKKNGRVGYDGTWSAKEDTNVGIVGVGYGDGYPQFAVNGTPVLVNGKICHLAGRVSMDMLAVDLSQQPEAKIGDPVVLWGQGLPVEHIAKHNQTSAYEIFTRMTPRPKIEVKGVLQPQPLEKEKRH